MRRTWSASQISEQLPADQFPERQESAQPTDATVDSIPGQGPAQPTDPSARGREAERSGYPRTTFTVKAGSAKVPVKPVKGKGTPRGESRLCKDLHENRVRDTRGNYSERRKCRTR
jgi:hypothetical protein